MILGASPSGVMVTVLLFVDSEKLFCRDKDQAKPSIQLLQVSARVILRKAGALACQDLQRISLVGDEPLQVGIGAPPLPLVLPLQLLDQLVRFAHNAAVAPAIRCKFCTGHIYDDVL